MIRSYKVRIYPTKEQEILMNKHIDCCRFIWNYMLALNLEREELGLYPLSKFGMSGEITLLKKQPQYQWLNEVSRPSLDIICGDLAEAYERFFCKISRKPKFKKRAKAKRTFPVRYDRTYFKDEFNIEEIDVHKFEMLCPNDEIKELCLSLIKTNPECDYFSSVNKSAVEVYLKKNTKGSAILKAIDFLDIKIENTYAFGDGKNDIEMLLTVGCGIAMGNANDEVKNHSNKITDTVQNDGVAKGIEQYVYID